MEKAGTIYRQLRIARNLTQKDVSDGFFSPTGVSEFENNNREIGYETLYELLRRINVTSAEFQHAIQGYKADDFNILLRDINKFYYAQDIPNLKSLLEKEQAKKKICNQELTCLMIKIMLSEIDVKTAVEEYEKRKIINHLLDLPRWGYYELVLFSNSMGIFEKSTLKLLSKDIMSRSQFYQEIPHNRKMIIAVLMNVMNIFIRQDEFVQALKIKREIEQLLGTEDTHDRVILLFLTGMLEFDIGETEKGIAKMQSAINVFETVGNASLADFYRATLESIIANQK